MIRVNMGLKGVDHGMRWCGGVLLVLASLLAHMPVAAGDIESEVQQIIAGAALARTQVSVHLLDLRTGRSLIEINADQPMVPASTMKLLTTAAALTRLGPDFKFSTTLELLPAEADAAASTAGPRRGGSGPSAPLPSLLIRGSGDPAFGDPALLASAGLYLDDLMDLWVQAVVDTGQKRFAELWLDDRVFDQQFVHPDWPVSQLHRFSYSEVAGINFYENLMAVLPVPLEPGQAPQVQTEPWFPQLNTTNRATTGRVDDFDIQRPLNTNRFMFFGSVRNRRSEPFRVTVHDPPVFFADFFRYRLQQAGISVARIDRVDPRDRIGQGSTEVLHQINTTLAGVIDRTNRDSQNLFAEALLKRMGHELTGAPGSFENGASAVRLFLRDRMADHIGLSGVRVADGSGLSPKNQLTTRVISTLLQVMQQDETLGPIYSASLAYAGHSGTLRDRMRGLRSSVYAKSGFLGASANYASSLAGYIVRPDGRSYAFAMIFNGFRPPISNQQIRDLQDRLIEAIDRDLAGSGESRR